MQFISLSPEPEKDVAAFVREFNITWPVGHGAEPTFKALSVPYIPALFVVGRDGRIAWNSETGGELSSAIEAALSDK